MIRLKLMLCAENIIRDAETNNISAINIFEEINPEGLPLLITHFSVLTVLERDEDDEPEVPCSLHIALSGETILDHPFNANFQDKKRTRSIGRILGLPLPRPGILEVTFSTKDGAAQGQYIIDVNSPRQVPVITSQE